MRQDDHFAGRFPFNLCAYLGVLATKPAQEVLMVCIVLTVAGTILTGVDTEGEGP